MITIKATTITKNGVTQILDDMGKRWDIVYKTDNVYAVQRQAGAYFLCEIFDVNEECLETSPGPYKFENGPTLMPDYDKGWYEIMKENPD